MERIHGKLHKKDLYELNYYDVVVSHAEPDILEYEIKWVLGSTAVNKASGCDGIPVELFKTLKDDAIKMVHSIVSKPERLSSGYRTGKCQFSS